MLLIGRLTRDPELRYTVNANLPVLNFTLAVDRPYSNQQGERSADFIDVICWRQLADHCSKYLRKGLLTAVSGRLEIRTYEAQDGQKRRIAEVVADEVRFLEWPKEQQKQTEGWEGFGQELRPAQQDDDDLPY